jgi:hypothetical protein
MIAQWGQAARHLREYGHTVLSDLFSTYYILSCINMNYGSNSKLQSECLKFERNEKDKLNNPNIYQSTRKGIITSVWVDDKKAGLA